MSAIASETAPTVSEPDEDAPELSASEDAPIEADSPIWVEVGRPSPPVRRRTATRPTTATRAPRETPDPAAVGRPTLDDGWRQ